MGNVTTEEFVNTIELGEEVLVKGIPFSSIEGLIRFRVKSEGRVNVREKPDINPKIIGKLRPNDVVKVIEHTDNWYHVVTSNGRLRFVFKELLEKAELIPIPVPPEGEDPVSLDYLQQENLDIQSDRRSFRREKDALNQAIGELATTVEKENSGFKQPAFQCREAKVWVGSTAS